MGREADDREQIRSILGTINAAWHAGREVDLNACFHDQIVIRALPGLQQMAAGREASVQSYRDFNQQALVKEFKSSEPAIDIAGDSAIAAFNWEIRYELQGRDYHETGYDIFALTRSDFVGWRAVWRGIHFAPQSVD